MPGAPSNSLLLVAMAGAPSSFLFLVVRPGAPSSVLAPKRSSPPRDTKGQGRDQHDTSEHGTCVASRAPVCPPYI